MTAFERKLYEGMREVIKDEIGREYTMPRERLADEITEGNIERTDNGFRFVTRER